MSVPTMDTYNIKYICQLENDKEALHVTLVKLGLIPAEGTYMCPKCGNRLKLYQDSSRIDGYLWMCTFRVKVPKTKKWKKCGTTVSYRTGTLFAGSKLLLVDILLFIAMWVARTPLTSIRQLIGTMPSTASVKWAKVCRKVVYEAMEVNRKPLGGPGKVVEIDESKFGRRKYHRGHKVEGQWVFGMYERGSAQVCLFPVENRNRETLVPLIQEWVVPGTTIISNCWHAYDTLGESGYEHLTVNRSLTFVDPDTGAHTNSILGVWCAAKSVALAPGTLKKNIPGNLARYMFCKRCRDLKLDGFVEFCRMAGNLHDPRRPRLDHSEPVEERGDDVTKSEDGQPQPSTSTAAPIASSSGDEENYTESDEDE